MIVIASALYSKQIGSFELSRQKDPWHAMLVTITRRLDRFLESPDFWVRDWYEPIVKGLKAQRAGSEP